MCINFNHIFHRSTHRCFYTFTQLQFKFFHLLSLIALVVVVKIEVEIKQIWSTEKKIMESDHVEFKCAHARLWFEKLSESIQTTMTSSWKKIKMCTAAIANHKSGVCARNIMEDEFGWWSRGLVFTYTHTQTYTSATKLYSADDKYSQSVWFLFFLLDWLKQSKMLVL